MLYLVCFTNRSGSSHLCDLLREAGLGTPAEYYFPYAFEERVAQTSFAGNQLFNPRARTPREYLENVVASQPGTAAGIKCVWLSLQVMRQELGDYFQTLDLRYVYLRRRDQLRQAISWYRAAATRRWSVFDAPAASEPPFDRRAIDHYLRYVQLDEQRWDEFFSTRRVLRLAYEDLGDHTPLQVARFLGMPATGAGRSNFRVQRDAITEAWVRQYRSGD